MKRRSTVTTALALIGTMYAQIVGTSCAAASNNEIPVQTEGTEIDDEPSGNQNETNTTNDETDTEDGVIDAANTDDSETTPPNDNDIGTDVGTSDTTDEIAPPTRAKRKRKSSWFNGFSLKDNLGYILGGVGTALSAYLYAGNKNLEKEKNSVISKISELELAKENALESSARWQQEYGIVSQQYSNMLMKNVELENQLAEEKKWRKEFFDLQTTMSNNVNNGLAEIKKYQEGMSKSFDDLSADVSQISVDIDAYVSTLNKKIADCATKEDYNKLSKILIGENGKTGLLATVNTLSENCATKEDYNKLSKILIGKDGKSGLLATVNKLFENCATKEDYNKLSKILIGENGESGLIGMLKALDSNFNTQYMAATDENARYRAIISSILGYLRREDIETGVQFTCYDVYNSTWHFFNDLMEKNKTSGNSVEDQLTALILTIAPNKTIDAETVKKIMEEYSKNSSSTLKQETIDKIVNVVNSKEAISCANAFKEYTLGAALNEQSSNIDKIKNILSADNDMQTKLNSTRVLPGWSDDQAATTIRIEYINKFIDYLGKRNLLPSKK